MENLQDTFGDLAAFSLANEIINNDVSEPVASLSIFNSEYIHYIYIGITILVIIIGLLAYKFNYVKRKPAEFHNNEFNQRPLNNDYTV